MSAPNQPDYQYPNNIGLDKLSLGDESSNANPQSNTTIHFPFQQNHPKPPPSPPIGSASVPQLNSDMKARILAFQQKRTKPMNSPPLSGIPSPNSSNLNSFSLDSDYPNIRQNVSTPPPNSNYLHNTPPTITSNLNSEKPLPAVPGTTRSDQFIAKRSLSTNDSAPIELIPSPQPENSHGQFNNHTTLSSTAQDSNLPHGLTSNTTPQAIARLPESVRISAAATASNIQSSALQKTTSMDIKKKPSLSQRRGMKLNVNDLTNPTPSTANGVLSPAINLDEKAESNLFSRPQLGSSPPLQTTGGLSRRLSERKHKPNFKLNLDASNSDLPQHRRTNSTSSNASEDQNDADGDKKPQYMGLFANYSKYVDIKSGQLNFSGKASLHSKGVDFSSGSSFRISLEDMEFIEELGKGNYGSVSKVLHKPTGVTMAMKEVRLELDENKFTQILMELEILHKCDSPYIVDFYGAFFVEGAVYMCIEYMDGGSLDKLFGKENGVKDEACLAYISESVIRGLKELKDEHNIIHRDVKPTNILINTLGKVKLCDFGVSGNLVASLAKTNIGCQSYMAPERIKSLSPDDVTYSVQSDIWSLGLTILEVAAGHYPYPSDTYGNIFSQLSAIVDGEPPKLDPAVYSKEAQMFVRSCLNKNPELRPSYAALLNNSWLIKYRDIDPHMAEVVNARAKEWEEKNKTSMSRSNSTKSKRTVASSMGQAPPNIDNVQSLLRSKVRPALHKGGLGANRNFLNNR